MTGPPQEPPRHDSHDVPGIPWPGHRSGSPTASNLSSLPCVGCGWCCLSDPCAESHILYGYLKRCPDLYWDETGGRYRCRLAEDPAKGERMRFLLGIGYGCCAPLNGWRDDVRDREKK